VAAAGFLVSAVTFALPTLGLTGPTEPKFGGDLDEYLAAYLAYRRNLFGYEQLENWSLAAALLAFGLLGQLLPYARAVRDRITANLAATLLLSGTLIAAATQIYYLGALDRVLFASDVEGFEDAPLATMADAITRTDDYLENFGLMLVAIGLAAMAWLCHPRLGWPRAWPALCLLLAATLVAVVATSFGSSDLTDPLLLVAGVLAALWSMWLSRLLSA
jgi:hypothetical protein